MLACAASSRRTGLIRRHGCSNARPQAAPASNCSANASPDYLTVCHDPQMACPLCGGASRSPIAPGYWRCTSLVEELAPGPGLINAALGPPVFRTTRECRNEYAEGTGTQGLICPCGTFAIGLCKECSLPVCGEHSAILVDARLCGNHYHERQKQIKSEQAARAAALAASAAKLEQEQGEPFFRSGAARQLLLEVQVPTVELWVIETGRDGNFTPAGRGWLLGEFGWRWKQRGTIGGDEVTGEYNTFLLDETQGDSLTPAYRHKKRDCYIVWDADAELISNWREVSFQVRQLAGKKLASIHG